MGLSIATRDYARQQRPKGTPPRGKAAPRKAASSKNAPRVSAALGLPLWAWMVVSLSLIVLAAVLYYISRPVAPMDMAPSSEAKGGKAEKTIEIPPKEPSRFTFYEMLPSYEVVVPDEVINPPKPKPGATRNNLPAEAVAAVAEPMPEAPAAKPAEKPTTASDVKPVSKPVPPQPSAEESLAAAIAREAPPQPSSQLAKGERFLIQVAAFRSKADAEQRVAALTLAGLAARVEQVTIDGKDTWYRVRLGPYGSAAAAAEAQRSLKAQGFSGVVMKVKG